MDINAVGRYLLKTRKLYKLTQEELADRLQVSRQAISKWETGAALPDIESLLTLSALYGVTVNEIMEADESKIMRRLKPAACKEAGEHKNIGVIGCGRWGTFIGWYLDKIGHNVTIYGRKESSHLGRLMREHGNEYVSLREEIALTHDIHEILKKEIIIVSIAAQGLAELMSQLAELQVQNKIFVLCMKGLDITSGRRLSQIVDDTLDKSNKTAVWLGPGHVEDYYAGIPNCMVIDGKDEFLKKELISWFSSDLIRFYYGVDLVGNEIGAAAKNVIGIAAGMLDALGYRSLKGPLMTRGTHEVAGLIKAMGGKELSAYGLCHLGDYEATLFSEHSHNRQFGEKFVLKQPYEALAEGYYTVKAIVNLAKNYGVEVPICSTVYDILYQGAEARNALDKLFDRSIKEEFPMI